MKYHKVYKVSNYIQLQVLRFFVKPQLDSKFRAPFSPEKKIEKAWISADLWGIITPALERSSSVNFSFRSSRSKEPGWGDAVQGASGRNGQTVGVQTTKQLISVISLMCFISGKIKCKKFKSRFRLPKTITHRRSRRYQFYAWTSWDLGP